MSAANAEIEEGEITDSDSMGEEEEKSTAEAKPLSSKPQQYSLFGDQPKLSFKPIPRAPRCDSESSGSEDSDNDGAVGQKRSKFHSTGTDSHKTESFVNPNFMKNGGVMPPMPKQSSRAIWGSVLQEQILTAEVGGFTMEKKVIGDRNVESYDYTRAKEDDRPHVIQDEIKHEDELFGEVIDLEQSALKQKKTLKRKHVGERLGQRKHVKERLDELPPVTEHSSVEEVTFYISRKLEESKIHLIRRVVKTLKPGKALDLYRKTEEVEAAGGMMVLNGSRRRTKGGVFLTLLKSDTDVTKEQLDEIFEEENQRFLESKKRKKLKAQRRRQERKRLEKQQAKPEAEVKENNPGAMEVVEDSNSRSSVEGQTGSPKNHADHLSDTQEEVGEKERQLSGDSDSGDSAGEVEEDFQSSLERELKRQAASRQSKGVKLGDGGDNEAVTLDDVLDIGVDEDFIE